MTDSLEDLGGVKMDLAFYLFLAWIIVCVCLAKGVRTSGKVRHPVK